MTVCAFSHAVFKLTLAEFTDARTRLFNPDAMTDEDASADSASTPAVEVPRFSGCVRVRGLPFSARDVDVRLFFDELQPMDILFTKDGSGRPSGEAYVTFDSIDETEEALRRHMHYLDKRYIEVFRSNESEFAKAQQKMAEWSGDGPPKPKCE